MSSVIQARKKLLEITEDDRRLLENEEDRQAVKLFLLIRKGRHELSTRVFNDWLVSVGMFGHPVERLRRAQAVYKFALGEIDD